MNYNFLTILVSIILLLVTYMQYKNNKDNFLINKLPIINIKDITGCYENNKILFKITIENVGDSPAVDILISSNIQSNLNNNTKTKYSKINMLKENNDSQITIIFEKNEIKEFLDLIKKNSEIFDKVLNKKKTIYYEKEDGELLLPTINFKIMYRNIFKKSYEYSYCRGIYKLLYEEGIKIVNFVSEEVVIFSLKNVSNKKYKTMAKKYLEYLPFSKI